MDVSFGTATWIRHVDARVVAKHLLERTGLTLSLQWRGSEVMLENIHNPDSKKRPWKGQEQKKESHWKHDR